VQTLDAPVSNSYNLQQENNWQPEKHDFCLHLGIPNLRCLLFFKVFFHKPALEEKA